MKERLIPEDILTHIDAPTEDSPIPSEVLASRKKTFLVTLSMYILAWIVYWAARDKLWNLSVSISASLSNQGGFLLVYSWIFSEIFYKWYLLVIGILLLLTPRKERALTCVTTFIISYTVRQYIRLISAEARPQYTTTDIKFWGGCDCSFGMPSGHSEGSAMLYALLFYCLTPPGTSPKARMWIKVVYFYIVLSIMFARVFYGRHSIPQVVIGALQSGVFFTGMLAYEDRLNEFFKGFLNGEQPQTTTVLIGSTALTGLTAATWLLYFDDSVAKNQVTRSNNVCTSCFDNNSFKIRVDLGKSFCYPTMSLGLALGYVLLKPMYQDFNEHLFLSHLNSQGLFRTLLMVVLHAPLLIVLLLQQEAKILIPVDICLYIFVGFLLSYGMPRLFSYMKLSMPGDLEYDGRSR